MWKNTVEPNKPQITKRLMRILCWISEATNTHLKYAIDIAFPLQQWLHERASMLLYEGWNFNSGNYLFTTDTK